MGEEGDNIGRGEGILVGAEECEGGEGGAERGAEKS